MNITEEIEKVKQELLDLILDHLRKNKIAPDQAQQQARDFLSVLPIKDQTDLLTKLKNLGQKYPESEKVYLNELERTTEQKRDQVLNQMRDLIRQGNIESAIASAKTLTNSASGN